MELCRSLNAFYIDTVNEPWAGFYFDKSKGPAARTNHALRELTLDARRRNPGGTTAVSCCGANPGMVSWFVKQALIDIATDSGLPFEEPTSREDWARLMRRVGVKGIHIAERDTQRAKSEKRMGVFVNTWSVEGFVSEGMQPAELGWGTHESWMPGNAGTYDHGSAAAIYLLAARRRYPRADLVPDARLPIRLPGHAQRVDLDRGLFYRARGRKGRVSPDLPLRLPPLQRGGAFAARDVRNAGKVQEEHHILDENEIVDGIDELGVLLYGQERLLVRVAASIDETRRPLPTRTPPACR